MATFYITFGQKYRREVHPALGARPELPDGWLTVEAGNFVDAFRQASAVLDRNWSSIYNEETFTPDYFPAGHLGSLQQALAHHRG